MEGSMPVQPYPIYPDETYTTPVANPSTDFTTVVIPAVKAAAKAAHDAGRASYPVTKSARRYIKPEDFAIRALDYIEKSKLVGLAPTDGNSGWGVKTGTAKEWTILIIADTIQECDFQITDFSDIDRSGSVTSDTPYMGSFGLGQMSPGDGEGSWAKGYTRTLRDILDPDKATQAIVAAHAYYIERDKCIAHKKNGDYPAGIARLNGSYRDAHGQATKTKGNLPRATDILNNALGKRRRKSPR
jgi:hypothetical protein